MYNIILSDINTIFVSEKHYQIFFRDINDNFIDMCYGVKPNKYVSSNEIIKEFLIRYDKKDHDNKVGISGELIFNLLLRNSNLEITSVSKILNQEDRSQKKGFDMLFLHNSILWYSEVKSGFLHCENLINQTNNNKISLALLGIKEKLNPKIEQRNSNHWLNAKMHICNSEKPNKLKKQVAILLDADFRSSIIDSIVVGTVIFQNSNIHISNMEQLRDKLEEIQMFFTNATLLCIREKTMDTVINYLRGTLDEE